MKDLRDRITRVCRECGGPMEWQEFDHHEAVGSAIVHDCSESHLVCVRCGDYDLTDAELAGYERRAALAYFRCRVDAAPEPEAVKFARKACGCTRARLAVHLGISEDRVRAIESGEVSCSRGEELAIIDLLHAPTPKITVEWPTEADRADCDSTVDDLRKQVEELDRQVATVIIARDDAEHALTDAAVILGCTEDESDHSHVDCVVELARKKDDALGSALRVLRRATESDGTVEELANLLVLDLAAEHERAIAAEGKLAESERSVAAGQRKVPVGEHGKLSAACAEYLDAIRPGLSGYMPDILRTLTEEARRASAVPLAELSDEALKLECLRCSGTGGVPRVCPCCMGEGHHRTMPLASGVPLSPYASKARCLHREQQEDARPVPPPSEPPVCGGMGR